MNEFEKLQLEVQQLREMVQFMTQGKNVVFSRDILFKDTNDMRFGTVTGTKIGTASDQKIGFFGATPVVQQVAPDLLSESGSDSDSVARAEINKLRTLVLNLGLGA